MAVCWLFPGKTVTIDAPCLDCGEPLRIEIRDGRILRADPAGLFAYLDVPFSERRKNLPYS
ncbi:MAG: hypothetical protein HY423_08725 [Candidatus Lambdaproteobacteria bacterium]|nr:hypothetical protein [Candidatus Lambdaproteobacteria bacterium]